MPINLPNDNLHSILIFLRLRSRLALRTASTPLKHQIDQLHLTSTALMPILFTLNSSETITLTQTAPFLRPRGLSFDSVHTFAFGRASPLHPAFFTDKLETIPVDKVPSITQLVFSSFGARAAAKFAAQTAQNPPTNIEILYFYGFNVSEIFFYVSMSPLRTLFLDDILLRWTEIAVLVDMLPEPALLHRFIAKCMHRAMPLDEMDQIDENIEFNAMIRVFERLVNLREIEIEQPNTTQLCARMLQLPIEKRPKSFNVEFKNHFRDGKEFMWDAQPVQEGNILRISELSGFSEEMERALKDNLEWRVKKVEFPLAEPYYLTESNVQAVWEKYAVVETETKECFFKRSKIAQAFWALVVVFVSCETESLDCVDVADSIEETEEWIGFMDAVFLALRMNEARGVDGFWQRKRKLCIEVVVGLNWLKIPPCLEDWVRVSE